MPYKTAFIALTPAVAKRKLAMIANAGISRSKVAVKTDPNGLREIWVKGLTSADWRNIGY